MSVWTGTIASCNECGQDVKRRGAMTRTEVVRFTRELRALGWVSRFVWGVEELICPVCVRANEYEATHALELLRTDAAAEVKKPALSTAIGSTGLEIPTMNERKGNE